MKTQEGIIKLNEQLAKGRDARGMCLAQENHVTVPHCLVGDVIECQYRLGGCVSISGENYYKCSYVPTYRREVS